MSKSAWGSDDPTKAAFPFLHGHALARLYQVSPLQQRQPARPLDAQPKAVLDPAGALAPARRLQAFFAAGEAIPDDYGVISSFDE